MNDAERSELERLRAENEALRRRQAGGGDLASEAQCRALASMTAPERLALLSKREAIHLIGFLKGPPGGYSRAQELYLYGLIRELPGDVAAALIERLVAHRNGTRALPVNAPAQRLRWQPGGPVEGVTVEGGDDAA